MSKRSNRKQDVDESDRFHTDCNLTGKRLSARSAHIRSILEQEFTRIVERRGSLTVDEILSLRVLLGSVFSPEELNPVLSELVAKEFQLETLDSRTRVLAVP